MNKFSVSLSRKNKSDVRAWLEQQEAYTKHGHVRKRFLRNPYTVSNLMDVWESNLLEVQSLEKYNDTYSYILSVIDVFSKYLHLFPVKNKSGPSITSAIRSLFHDDDSRRPVWLRTDKGKEFLYKHFQHMFVVYVNT